LIEQLLGIPPIRDFNLDAAGDCVLSEPSSQLQ